MNELTTPSSQSTPTSQTAQTTPPTAMSAAIAERYGPVAEVSVAQVAVPDAADALQEVADGHARGKVVVTVRQ